MALVPFITKAKNESTRNAIVQWACLRGHRFSAEERRVLQQSHNVNIRYQPQPLVPTTNTCEIPIYCITCCRKQKKRELKYEVGIISAFAPEIDEFEGRFTEEFPPVDIAGRRFFRGILEGKLVVITVCGIGMTNSAMTTQLMIDYFNPKWMFFSGIAGGMNPSPTPGHRIGDVVIARRWAEYQHQKFIRSNTNEAGEPICSFRDFGVDFPDNFFRIVKNPDPRLGTVLAFTRPICAEPVEGTSNELTLITPPPPAPAFPALLNASGFAIPMEVEVLRNGGDYALVPVPQQFFFYVDPYLLTQAQIAIQNLVLPDRICLDVIPPVPPAQCQNGYQPVVVIGDLGVASSTFVDNAEYRQDVFNQFQQGGVTVDLVDMESSAFAHVCESNRKPFIVIRSLSDLAGGDVDINPILRFIAQAARNSVFTTVAILQQLPTEPKNCRKLVTRSALHH